MKELPNIDSALQYAREQERDFLKGALGGDFRLFEQKEEPCSELLYFPRKTVKVQKLKSGNWEPRARFIQERLEERVTSLDTPTDTTGIAISSGFRSAIVLQPDGSYVRMKGVSPQLHESLGRLKKVQREENALFTRGILYMTDAFSELSNLVALEDATIINLPMQPEFIELFASPVTPQDLASFPNRFHSQLSPYASVNFGFTKSPKEAEVLLNRFAEYAERNFPRNSLGVAGYRIVGDTRLDEAIYELTKESLTGEKRRLRDELVLSLAFNAGIAVAQLNILGLAWSPYLGNTNSHIGNFVINRRFGKVNVGLCDLAALATINSFEDRASYWAHIKDEIEGFGDDFFLGTTFSHSRAHKYKDFPFDLRVNCFQAFKTGYSIIFKNEYRKIKTILPDVAVPEFVTVPDKTIYSDEEFRAGIKEVTE